MDTSSVTDAVVLSENINIKEENASHVNVSAAELKDKIVAMIKTNEQLSLFQGECKPLRKRLTEAKTEIKNTMLRKNLKTVTGIMNAYNVSVVSSTTPPKLDNTFLSQSLFEFIQSGTVQERLITQDKNTLPDLCDEAAAFIMDRKKRKDLWNKNFTLSIKKRQATESQQVVQSMQTIQSLNDLGQGGPQARLQISNFPKAPTKETGAVSL